MRLCTVCARGGSKGVPGKNLRPLQGRPLIAHTIGHALDSGLFDAVAVSSDSEDILEVGRRSGATIAIQRPAELASDDAGKVPAIVHCLRRAEEQLQRRFDVLVDLDATSPLRHIGDIVGAVRLLEETNATSVVTACESRRSPYFNMIEMKPDGTVELSKKPLGKVLRRQDAPPCFDMNASIYVWQRDAFLKEPMVFYRDTRLFVMPAERSHDIDTELDWAWVAFLMERASGGS